MTKKTLLVGMLLGSAMVAFVPFVSAQTVVKTAASGQGLSEPNLTQRYTPLASGAANAKAMVLGLRKGEAFTLTSTQTVTTPGGCRPTPMGCTPLPSSTTTTTVNTTITPPESKSMGWGNVDLTLICEAPKIGPHREAMRAKLASLLGVEPGQVSIKATTTELLGFTGRGEGIAAQAVATLITEGSLTP